MTWEQHRYAVERAAQMRRKMADDYNEATQGVNLQGEANGSDAELLNDVAEFLGSLDASKNDNAWDSTFVKDWNEIIARVSNFAGKWDLPKPDMLFHPKWLARMMSISRNPIGGTLIYAGVRVKFGFIKQAEVFETV